AVIPEQAQSTTAAGQEQETRAEPGVATETVSQSQDPRPTEQAVIPEQAQSTTAAGYEQVLDAEETPAGQGGVVPPRAPALAAVQFLTAEGEECGGDLRVRTFVYPDDAHGQGECKPAYSRLAGVEVTIVGQDFSAC